jgi:predicted DNA-binding transcriptional regulator AlpA
MNANLNISGLEELIAIEKAQLEKLGKIEALLKIDKDDEREFITANKFCMKHGISRRTLDKRVKEGSVELNKKLGGRINRYRLAVKGEED